MSDYVRIMRQAKISQVYAQKYRKLLALRVEFK